jgi:hypothetical protein
MEPRAFPYPQAGPGADPAAFATAYPRRLRLAAIASTPSTPSAHASPAPEPAEAPGADTAHPFLGGGEGGAAATELDGAGADDEVLTALDAALTAGAGTDDAPDAELAGGDGAADAEGTTFGLATCTPAASCAGLGAGAVPMQRPTGSWAHALRAHMEASGLSGHQEGFFLQAPAPVHA